VIAYGTLVSDVQTANIAMPEINFFWDPLSDNILQERDETGAVTAEYTTEPGLYGSVISQNRGGMESQFHYDAQGSALAVTDDNQNVTDTFAYSAFGEVTERTGTTEVPFQYIGQNAFYRDSLTGYYSARQTGYESSRGRFLVKNLSMLLATGNAYQLSPSGNLLTAVLGALTFQSTAASPPICVVELTCVSMWFSFPFGPVHCGMEVYDGSGTWKRYHVFGRNRCYFEFGRPEPFNTSYGDYYRVAKWEDPSGRLCNCIASSVKAMNSAGLNYQYRPTNVFEGQCRRCGKKDICQCKTQSTCNSYYATNCILKSCGIVYDGWTWNPVGWSHRMRECVQCSNVCREEEGEEKCEVMCDRWKTTDDAWCTTGRNASIKKVRVGHNA